MPNHQLNVPSPSSHLPVLSTFLTDVCNPTIIRYSETSGVVLASSVQSKGGEGVVERNDVVAGFSQKVTRAVTTQLQTFLCILNRILFVHCICDSVFSLYFCKTLFSIFI